MSDRVVTWFSAVNVPEDVVNKVADLLWAYDFDIETRS